MPLQLHLKHSLVERLIVIDPRPSDQPIVIGRAANADVEIPSSGVSKRHCLLFVRDGHWFAQDAGSTAGTFVNGVPLSAVVKLASGDVIALGAGANPPRLTVDPQRMGVVEGAEGHPGDPEQPSAPQAAKGGSANWSLPGVGGPAPLPPPVTRGPVSVPAYRPTAYVGTTAQRAESSEWENVPRTSQFYVPRRKGVSAGTTAVFIVLVIGITVGGGIWLYKVYQQRMGPNAKPQVIVVTRVRNSATTSAVDEAPTTRIVIRRAAPPLATAPAPPPIDPRRQDPEWLAIEQARYEEPVLAIVKFNDFMERFPDTPFKKDLNQFIEEALDRIWWKRLMNQFQERDAAQKQIADRKLQIKQSQDPQFKQGLEIEIAEFQKKSDAADKIIRSDMKYANPKPPNMYDSQELAIDRANRDPGLYAKWREEVLSAIKGSRGQRLPWSSSR